MSDSFSLTVDVYSPRWGHTDPYTVTISTKSLAVHSNTRSAECTLNGDGEPIWSGYNDTLGNPLMRIFDNDLIYAPAVVPDALEWAFGQWLDDPTKQDEIEEGLRELFQWIDATARGMPSAKLWQPYFG